MLRREALTVLLGSSAGLLRGGGARCAAVLVDVRDRRAISVQDSATAGQVLAPPGSTLKPLVLAELLRSQKLSAGSRFACPGKLTIGGRSFACSHPPLASAVDIPSAIAYSCNCFTAHFAARLEPGELASAFVRSGLGSRTGFLGAAEASGRVEGVAGTEPNQLQALGEGGVLVTVAGLAAAYRWLAVQASAEPAMAPIVDGLEGAVEFGTAQLARVPGVKVAGKTGSVRTSAGGRIAWFAGFMPSRAPQVAIAVMLPGRSGGADAAPVAARILKAYRAGHA